MKALVSIIIPCYNHGPYLAEAIESAKAQAWQPVEIIVVDDGSTDDSGKVAARYPDIRYVRQPNMGLAAARNTGAREARGDYFIFLDADDHLTPQAVQSGMECLARNPQAAFAYGAGIGFDDGGTYHDPLPPIPPGENPYEHLLRSNYIWMVHMSVYRRSAFEAVGGYDLGFDGAADYALNLKLSRSYPVAYHSAIVAETRYRPGSMSRNLPVMLGDILRVMEAQRPHTAGDPFLSRALRIGIRNWKRTFAIKIAQSLAAQTRSRSLSHGTRREVATMLRIGPGAGARIIASRARRSLRGNKSLRSAYYFTIALRQMAADEWRDHAVFDRLFKANPDPWESGSESEAERIRITVSTLDAVHPERFGKTLEVGCAEGLFSRLMALRCERLHAVDYSAVALEHAAQNLADFPNVTLARLDIRTDRIEGKFDLVLAMGVLSYLFRPWHVKTACMKLIDALEPGGILIFSDTRHSSIFESARWAEFALRGGEQIRRWLARRQELELLRSEDTATHVFAAFRRK